MNKLPWFTHDHDAHQDLWVRKMIRVHGHQFHTLYWTLLELLHWHGKGDHLKIEWRELSNSTQIRTTKLRDMLNHPAIHLKILVTSTQDHVEIRIPKIRERWSKMKSKLPSTFLEPSLELEVEEDIDKEEDKEKENGKKTDFKFLSSLGNEIPKAYGPDGDSKSPEEEAKRKDFLKGQEEELRRQELL